MGLGEIGAQICKENSPMEKEESTVNFTPNVFAERCAGAKRCPLNGSPKYVLSPVLLARSRRFEEKPVVPPFCGR